MKQKSSENRWKASRCELVNPKIVFSNFVLVVGFLDLLNSIRYFAERVHGPHPILSFHTGSSLTEALCPTKIFKSPKNIVFHFLCSVHNESPWNHHMINTQQCSDTKIYCWNIHHIKRVYYSIWNEKYLCLVIRYKNVLKRVCRLYLSDGGTMIWK